MASQEHSGAPEEGGEKSVIALKLSPQAMSFLDKLAGKAHTTTPDVIRRALGLYKVALDAHLEGKAVGAAFSADALETEFAGF